MSSSEKDSPANCDHSCSEDCSHETENQISLDNLDDETKRKIQELQMIEQSLQQFLMQKQAFSMELDETNLCLTELEKSSGDLFKIVGGKIIIKTEKDSLKKELTHKKELLELRTKNMDIQEQDFIKKTEDLRQEIIKKISGSCQ